MPSAVWCAGGALILSDLKRVIEERFGVAYHERTIGKLLRALGFSHISARPRHPRQDGEVKRAYLVHRPAKDVSPPAGGTLSSPSWKPVQIAAGMFPLSSGTRCHRSTCDA